MAGSKKTGSIDGFFKNVKMIGTYVNKEYNYGLDSNSIANVYRNRPELYAFRKYGREIHLYLNNLNNHTSKLNDRDIKKLFGMNMKIEADTIFSKLTADLERKWAHSEISRKAMQKFADMAMCSDRQKLAYASKILNGSGNKMEIRDVFETPLPLTREATPEDEEILKNNVSELIKRLEETEGGFHVNSSAYNKMKTTILQLRDTLDTEGHTNTDIGKRLEALQDASMKYLQAKGVGNQSSTRGQLRMDASLDICRLSVDFMDVYASNERIAEVKQIEKEYGRSLTADNGVCNYNKEVSFDKYKEETAPQKENAPDPQRENAPGTQDHQQEAQEIADMMAFINR